MPYSKILLLILTILLLSGCGANFHSIGRQTSLGTSKAIHLDAEQRLVYFHERVSKDEDDKDGYIKVLCSEPSPDAINAFASSLAASLSDARKGKEDIKAAIGAAVAKSSASIGLRTQSIQLMRDAFYRNCESYFNGAIDSKEFFRIHEQFQDVMIGVLAIEQLTGAVAAPAVVVHANALAEAQTGTVSAEAKTPPGDTQITNIIKCEKDCSAKNLDKVSSAVQKIVELTLESRQKREEAWTIRTCLDLRAEIPEEAKGIAKKILMNTPSISSEMANNLISPVSQFIAKKLKDGEEFSKLKDGEEFSKLKDDHGIQNLETSKIEKHYGGLLAYQIGCQRYLYFSNKNFDEDNLSRLIEEILKTMK